MAKIRCEGCQKRFTHRALSIHLVKTPRPLCRAVYQRMHTYLPDLASSSEEELQDSDSNTQQMSPTVASNNVTSYEFPTNDDHFSDPPNPNALPSLSSDIDTESTGSEPDSESDDEHGRVLNTEQQERRQALMSRPVVEQFPSDRAGEVISNTISGKGCSYNFYLEELTNEQEEFADHIYAPFTSKLDWEVARWAKLRGPGSTSASELLNIDGVHDRLGLSYKNTRELNKIIDSLPDRPKFTRSEIRIGDETLDLYHRNIIECIDALYGDPEFAPHLLLVPERHYKDEDRTIRMFGEMNTGKWWWDTQKALEKDNPGATIIPVIVSTDKTQLTLFRNKAAYPVYLTIGNIPKEIRRKPARRGQILIGYLPTTRLQSFASQASRRRALANLFHACMSRIFEPLKTAGVDGVAMQSGDGLVRRIHPILAAYVGDYPEQLLVTCCKNFDCPKCPIPRSDIGLDLLPDLRDLDEILDALDTIEDGPAAYADACTSAGIKPVFNPFWADLPHTNIFRSITPDILHQLYQGILKHLISWLKQAFGGMSLDERCKCLPPNHALRQFNKGISSLSHVSGKEHADMCRILLALIIELRLPDNRSPSRVIRAVRALLDFLYIAQFPVQNTTTLSHLTNALTTFHDNKDVFIDLGIRSNFNIPKLHSLQHYVPSIELFGTTDNYNTEYTERLHIDFAKDAYRATNHKDEYPQMTTWLTRKEKVLRHVVFIGWRVAGCPPIQREPMTGGWHQHIKMTRHPSTRPVDLSTLATRYGAHNFRKNLTIFIAQQNFPDITRVQVQNVARNIVLPFNKIAVYHKIKFWIPDVLNRVHVSDTFDVAHIRPLSLRLALQDSPQAPRGRFDTVLVNVDEGATGIHRYRVAQIRAIFRLPKTAQTTLFRAHVDRLNHLAYVNWFSKFPNEPDRNHRLYKISHSIKDGERESGIIRVADIERSVALIPRFGPVLPSNWTSDNVLEECTTFYVNAFTDRHAYISLY